MSEIWTPSSSGQSVVSISNTFADHLDRLVAAQRSARGSFLPVLGSGSAASRHLAAQADLQTDSDPAPVRDVLGTLERLTVAVEDELRGLARVFRGPEPPWFAHIPLVRGSVELLSRVWWLSDPTVDGDEIVRRHWNERLYEVGFIAAQVKAASAMPPDAVAEADQTVAALRKTAADWGAVNGHTMSGKYLGAGRPGALDLIVRLYEANNLGVDGMDAVARDQYSKLSAVSHGLPEGLTRYLVELHGSDHGHLLLTAEKLLESTSSLVVAYEAAILRLFQFYGWTMPVELKGERMAIQLWRSRAAGLVAES